MVPLSQVSTCSRPEVRMDARFPLVSLEQGMQRQPLVGHRCLRALALTVARDYQRQRLHPLLSHPRRASLPRTASTLTSVYPRLPPVCIFRFRFLFSSPRRLGRPSIGLGSCRLLAGALRVVRFSDKLLVFADQSCVSTFTALLSRSVRGSVGSAFVGSKSARHGACGRDFGHGLQKL